MFGPTYSDLQGVSDHHSATCCAIMKILIDKGICTAAEFQAARTWAVAAVDQRTAQMRDEALKENPAAALFASLLGDGLSDAGGDPPPGTGK